MYIVDMYRAVVEHPDFMPPELQKRPDLTLGKDKGRIWRIVPEKYAAKSPRPQLSKATTKELAKLLGHPNAWRRTTAQRLLLLKGQDRTAVSELKKIVADNPTAGNPGHDRVHAAWLLKSCGALGEGYVAGLLDDQRPGVREHGVAHGRVVFARVVSLAGTPPNTANDPDPQVRFQSL